MKVTKMESKVKGKIFVGKVTSLPKTRIIHYPRQEDNSYVGNFFSISKQENSWTAMDSKEGRQQSFTYSFPHVNHVKLSEKAFDRALKQKNIWLVEYQKKGIIEETRLSVSLEGFENGTTKNRTYERKLKEMDTNGSSWLGYEEIMKERRKNKN